MMPERTLLSVAWPTVLGQTFFASWTSSRPVFRIQTFPAAHIAIFLSLLGLVGAGESAPETASASDCQDTGLDGSGSGADTTGNGSSTKVHPTAILFLFTSFAIGALMRQIFKNTRIP